MDILSTGSLEIVATVLVIVGVSILTIPKRWALIVLFFAQIAWALFGYFEEQWFFMGQSIFLWGLNVVAILNWKRKGIG